MQDSLTLCLNISGLALQILGTIVIITGIQKIKFREEESQGPMEAVTFGVRPDCRPIDERTGKPINKMTIPIPQRITSGLVIIVVGLVLQSIALFAK